MLTGISRREGEEMTEDESRELQLLIHRALGTHCYLTAVQRAWLNQLLDKREQERNRDNETAIQAS